MKAIDKLREIFLTEVDDDTRADNEQKIKEWEEALIHNEALASWKEHDVTKMIIQQARRTYLELCLQLLDRRHDEAYRNTLFSKRDAMEWIIQLASDDPKGEIEKINREIAAAINVTSA